MSEANVPPRRDPDAQSQPSARRRQASPQQANSQSQAQASDWETVNLPGALSVDDIPTAEVDPAEAGSVREAELLALIRDLNRCNETLMGRLNQLEEALETSQQALQAAQAREHHQNEADASQAAQQSSVAQLLSELEQSNDALKRQRILAETLQAQLDSSQQRVTQLEHEHTRLQQQVSQKTQALQQAEETNRDLRSRLQRQQRYTLQFKAALEKCLDMSPGRANESSEATLSAFQAASAGSGAVPKAARIQPWSAQSGPGQPDPQLLSLMRSTPTPPAAPTTDTTAAAPANQPPVDGEADDRLWQDLERVIEHSSPEATAAESPRPNPESELAFTEPSPWGPPVARQDQPEAAASAPDSSQAEAPDLATEAETTAQPHQRSHQESEPSAQTQSVLGRLNLPEDLPILRSRETTGPSPAPLVHPLRSQRKKRSSLSAVELPSFPPLSKDAQS